VRATGGWPQLVERTVDLATRGGATLETALETIGALYLREDVARNHLESVELDLRSVELLATWAKYLEPGEGCSHADIAAATDLTLDETRTFTQRLVDHGVLDDGEDGYAIDPVTFTSLQTLGRQE
jgi:hypothetical protein